MTNEFRFVLDEKLAKELRVKAIMENTTPAAIIRQWVEGAMCVASK